MYHILCHNQKNQRMAIILPARSEVDVLFVWFPLKTDATLIISLIPKPNEVILNKNYTNWCLKQHYLETIIQSNY